MYSHNTHEFGTLVVLDLYPMQSQWALWQVSFLVGIWGPCLVVGWTSMSPAASDTTVNHIGFHPPDSWHYWPHCQEDCCGFEDWMDSTQIKRWSANTRSTHYTHTHTHTNTHTYIDKCACARARAHTHTQNDKNPSLLILHCTHSNSLIQVEYTVHYYNALYTGWRATVEPL